MSKKYWTCPEDFDEDLLAVSDIYDGSFPRERELPSDHTRRARSKPSIYDDLPEEEEQNVQMRPGRGYPIVRNSGLGKPGGIASFLQQQNQTAKDIREACGLGFSNDIIERSLTSNHNKQSVTVNNGHQMPDICLTSSPTSSSSSKYSTPSASPVHTSASEGSSSQSPTLKHKQAVALTNNKVNPVSIYSQQDKVQRSSNKAPPPIYDILRSGKPAEKLKSVVTSPVEEMTKDYTTNLFINSGEKKSYNINSKRDFPELR